LENLTMNKHTPGPWLIAHIDGIDAVVTDDGTAVMDTRGASAADLTLAVNAPMLLAALQRLVHPMADDTDVEFAHATIARATYTE
jgi:hypothetical protein